MCLCGVDEHVAGHCDSVRTHFPHRKTQWPEHPEYLFIDKETEAENPGEFTPGSWLVGSRDLILTLWPTG